MSKYLNTSGICIPVVGETDINRDTLVAKIEVIHSESLVAATQYLRNFIEYDRENSVDVVVAELQDALAERLRAVMSGPEEEYHFSKTGHLCILFNHIQNRRKIPVQYTNIAQYPKTLKEVKKAMESQGKSKLYQICTNANKKKVRTVLEKEGFILT